MVPPFTNIRRSVICALIAILLTATLSQASTYISIGDEIYSLLSRLEAEGVITDALLSTKPLSRKEVLRLLQEAENNSADRSAFIRSLVQDLKQRLGPEDAGDNGLRLLDTVYVKYVDTNADVRTLTYPPFGTREKEQALNVNNDGDLYGHGSNERVGFTSRVEDAGGFSFFLNPEFKVSGGSHSDLVVKNGYAVFDFGWDLIAGRESQWWGPGYRGALLVSNNAEPLSLVKVANPSPVVLPWIFKYLGPFHFDLFVLELEKDRADVSEPYVWGMRVNFKPHPDLELGLERTALLGGRGRPTTVRTGLDSFLGRNEHNTTNVGDQRAGYDVKLTLPFESQPVQLYLEADAEDSFHVLPSQWAYLYGMYLPGLLSSERFEFRYERAQTDDGNSSRSSTWYTHGVYKAGYTYHGSIIGHYIGTDSRDEFAEITCRFPEKSARLSLAFDRAEHGVSMDIHEIDRELSLSARLNISRNVDLDLEYGYARIENAGLVPGAGQRSHSAGGTVTYRF